MNKKLLALLLAILMVAMSACAMAETGIYTKIEGIFNIKKAYEFGGKEIQSGFPEEVLNFTAEYVEVTDNETGAGADTAPIVTISSLNTVTDNLTKEGAIRVALPTNPKAGVYKYTIKEKAGSEAGITYSSDSFNFFVLVGPSTTADDGYAIKTIYVNDGTKKIDEFTFKNMLNKLGSVKITKSITGTIADTTDTFPVTITMTSSSPVTTNQMTISGAGEGASVSNFVEQGNSYVSNTSVNVTDNTEIVISNIPENVVVTVNEAEENLTVDGVKYTASYLYNNDKDATSVKVVTGGTKTIAITNNADASVPTGVSTDNLPYVLLMALVAIMAVAFVAKKRSVNE